MRYDTQANHTVPMEALMTLLDYITKDAEECSSQLEAKEIIGNWCIHMSGHVGVTEGL